MLVFSLSARICCLFSFPASIVTPSMVTLPASGTFNQLRSKKRCLTASAWSDQRYNFTFFYLKIQIFQNLIITKSFTKSSYFYYRHLNFSSLFYAHRSLSLQADVPKAYSIPSKSKILQYIPQSNDKISLQRFLPVP